METDFFKICIFGGNRFLFELFNCFWGFYTVCIQGKFWTSWANSISCGVSPSFPSWHHGSTTWRGPGWLEGWVVPKPAQWFKSLGRVWQKNMSPHGKKSTYGNKGLNKCFKKHSWIYLDPARVSNIQPRGLFSISGTSFESVGFIVEALGICADFTVTSSCRVGKPLKPFTWWWL